MKISLVHSLDLLNSAVLLASLFFFVYLKKKHVFLFCRLKLALKRQLFRLLTIAVLLTLIIYFVLFKRFKSPDNLICSFYVSMNITALVYYLNFCYHWFLVNRKI